MACLKPFFIRLNVSTRINGVSPDGTESNFAAGLCAAYDVFIATSTLSTMIGLAVN